MFNKRSSKESVVDFIVRQIEDAIIEQQLQPGDKLPPSRELQKMLGTSQGTLREALRVLEQKGLIEARLGRTGGLYVQAVTSAKMSESLALLIRQKQISLDDLMVFRKTLEVSAAAWAAVKADEAEIGRFKDLLHEMEAHLELGMEGFDRFFEVEDRMHRMVSEMTQNPLFESVLKTVYENHPGYNLEVVVPGLEAMKRIFQEWKNLAEAIENRRPDEAWQAMARHFYSFVPSPTTAPAGGAAEQ